MIFSCGNLISQAQSAKITLDIKEGKIEQALAEIQKQSPYKFMYNTKLVNVEQKITINAKMQLSAMHWMNYLQGRKFPIR